MRPKIGVLALQGSFVAHASAAQRAGARAVLVRRAHELADLDGLILPGGESTTQRGLLDDGELGEAIADLAAAGAPVLGTCAGSILMAREIRGPDWTRGLGLLDIAVQRNAYGRQLESFSAEVEPADTSQPPLCGIFIRAPVITACGAGVAVLGRARGAPVYVRQGARLACTFHPELSRDTRVHALLVRLACERGREAA